MSSEGRGIFPFGSHLAPWPSPLESIASASHPPRQAALPFSQPPHSTIYLGGGSDGGPPAQPRFNKDPKGPYPYHLGRGRRLKSYATLSHICPLAILSLFLFWSFKLKTHIFSCISESNKLFFFCIWGFLLQGKLDYLVSPWSPMVEMA